MTAYAAYYNLTAGNRIYKTNPTTGEVTEERIFNFPSTSSSKKQSKMDKKQSKLSKFLDAFKPIEEPLPPTPMYDSVLRRPLFEKAQPGNELTQQERRMWEAGKQVAKDLEAKKTLKKKDSFSTLVGEETETESIMLDLEKKR